MGHSHDKVGSMMCGKWGEFVTLVVVQVELLNAFH
jgi:hypothetical protein